MFLTSLTAFGALLPLAQSFTFSSISAQDTYLLPNPFSGNDTTSENSWTATTTAANSSLNTILRPAQNSSFIVYDDLEFFSIFDPQFNFTLIQRRDDDFAAEGGAWAWDRNQVWFSSSGVTEYSSTIYILDLANNSVSMPVLTGDPIVNPNGAYYFNRTVYFTYRGSTTYAPGIAAIDPATNIATNVVNSYFGLRFNFPDDVAWVRKGGYSYMFFTDLGEPGLLAEDKDVSPDEPPSDIQNAVWRFDPQRQTVRAVIPRSDIAVPNGLRVNADGTKLYVGDTSTSSLSGPANYSWGSAALYEYELNERALPVQKSMFSLTRQGFVDGIKVDDAGNVWTAEFDGIWIRSPDGETIAVINAAQLVETGTRHISNFALAGDTLIVFGQSQLWSLKLARQIVAPDNLS